MSETAGRFSPAFLGVREFVGDALHAAMHPKHPWSGCSDPDRVYEWMNRLADHLIDTNGAARAWVAFGQEYDREPHEDRLGERMAVFARLLEAEWYNGNLDASAYERLNTDLTSILAEHNQPALGLPS